MDSAFFLKTWGVACAVCVCTLGRAASALPCLQGSRIQGSFILIYWGALTSVFPLCAGHWQMLSSSLCGFYCKSLSLNWTMVFVKKKKREEEWREWKKPGEKLWGHERLCENCCLSQSACTQSCLCQRKKLPTQIMAGMWNRMAGQGNGGRGCVNWKLGSLCGHYKETWDVLTQRS